MLVEKKADAKRTKWLIGIVVVLLIVAGVVLYQAFFAVNTTITIRPSDSQVSIATIETVNPELTVDFLNQTPYTTLRRYGADPIPAAKTGRDNPFVSPFSFVTSTESL